MQDTVKKNLLQIQEDIAPYKPNIIAITKYFDEKAIIEAYDAGLRNFGESRTIEAIEKINKLPEQIRNDSHFHFIGHLQTNKIKKVIGAFDYIHSVDSYHLAKSISEEASKIAKTQKILLQVNNACEEQKFGFSKEAIMREFPEIQKLSNLDVVGIMNMAPMGAEESELDALFEDIYQLRKQLEERYNCNLKEISMGMSQDYQIASRHGATMLRIGRKLFK